MRKLILFLSLALLAGACGPGYYYGSTQPIYRSPGNIQMYADGSCWANGYWYAQCPWYGDAYGSYSYRSYGGYYGPRYYPPYRHNSYRPPRAWSNPPPRGYRPPPRVRDHRNYRVPARPPTRDHRRTGPRVRDHRRH